MYSQTITEMKYELSALGTAPPVRAVARVATIGGRA
jgi:hypothetical protein